MTVEKRYANSHINVLWTNPSNAEGVEDGVCSQTSSVDPLNNLDMYFGFAIPAGSTITQVTLDCKIAISFGHYLTIKLWNGDTLKILAELNGAGRPICATTAYLGSRDETTHLDTPAKVNAAMMRFHHVHGAGGGIPWTAYVDACWIQVTYTPAPSGVTHSKDFLWLTAPSRIPYEEIINQHYLAYRALKKKRSPALVRT